jgi:hypothetical protein
VYLTLQIEVVYEKCLIFSWIFPGVYRQANDAISFGVVVSLLSVFGLLQKCSPENDVELQ